MKKIEAPTLEEAFTKASEILSCSISDLQYEIIQQPSKGILGFLKKNVIIVATCTKKIKIPIVTKETLPIQEEVASKIIETVKEEVLFEEEQSKPPLKEIKLKSETIVDNFFEKESIDNEKEEESEVEEQIVYDELALLIENQLKELLSHSCFEIDVVEVDVRDNTALIFIDGDDAALLIGKEGYRYNALSYMLFNWLNAKYELFIKLEIAEFLTTQQEMIKAYIQPVIKNVEKHGRGKTRFLDGILVQIALEQLREYFPNKYVAIKKTKEGKRFIVINEFNARPHAK